MYNKIENTKSEFTPGLSLAFPFLSLILTLGYQESLQYRIESIINYMCNAGQQQRAKWSKLEYS